MSSLSPTGRRTCQILLLLLIGLEVVWLGMTAWHRTQRFQPPQPDLSTLDAISRDELLAVRNQLDSGSAADWLQLAGLYNIHGYFPEAEQCATVACELDPPNGRAWFERGLALHQTGRMEQAIACFERARPLVDRATAAMCDFCIGRNFLRLEQPEAAERAFRQAGSLLPARFDLAKLLIRKQQSDEAGAIIDELITSDPAEQEYYQLMLRLAEARGDVVQAQIAEFRSEWATDRRPTDAVIALFGSRLLEHGLERRFAASRALSRQGQFPAAARLAEDVLAADWQPRFATEAIRLELELSRFDRAEELLQTQIQLDGPTADRELLLGEIALFRQQPAAALAHWQRARQLDPFTSAAGRILAAKLVDTADAETQGLINEAVLAAARRGLLNRDWPRVRQQLDKFATAPAASASRQLAEFYAGVAAWHLKDFVAARKHWETAAEIQPTQDRIRRALIVVKLIMVNE